MRRNDHKLFALTFGFAGTLAAAMGAAGCSGDIRVDGDTGLSAGGAGTDETGDAGETSADEGSGDADTGEETDTGDDGPLFDLGEPEPPPPDGIPKTCGQAEALESTVGCLFYASDLDNHPVTTTDAWGVAVANVQDFETGDDAHVQVQVKIGDTWLDAHQGSVSPGELLLFEPDQFGHGPSALTPNSALRIVSDIPITAYQFNPIAAGRATSDASMLHPAVHWDHEYRILGTEHVGNDNNGELYAYLSVVASKDDTVVEIVPAVATHAGPGVPFGEPGMPFQVVLDEGDVLQVAALDEGDSLTGTVVSTDEDTPIGVFTAHRCAQVPIGKSACDHLEEQMLGVHQWGSAFVASRVPVRSGAVEIEPALWQIYAAEDDTTIEFDAHAEVTGLPQTPLVLDAGESTILTVGGTQANPGDFVIDASAPIEVMQYAVGGGMVQNLDQQAVIGDPASVQHAPADQFMERYVLLAPPKWVEDYVVVARPAGAEIRIDGDPISDDEFTPVGTGEFEVARIQVLDGAHTLDGDEPFSTIAVGWDAWDSYAYLGGSRTSFIYDPEG